MALNFIHYTSNLVISRVALNLLIFVNSLVFKTASRLLFFFSLAERERARDAWIKGHDALDPRVLARLTKKNKNEIRHDKRQLAVY